MESIEAFLDLSLSQKIKMLHEHGKFIVAIRYYEYKINLYLIDGIYVEVFYHHKKDQIEKIFPLDRKSTRLKFYLDQIRLDDSLFKKNK